jgi:hypothetical protein
METGQVLVTACVPVSVMAIAREIVPELGKAIDLALETAIAPASATAIDPAL